MEIDKYLKDQGMGIIENWQRRGFKSNIDQP